MTALLHTLRDLGVGLLYAMAVLYLLLIAFFLYAFIVVWAERLDRWFLRRRQDKELQQAMEDWPKPVPFREDPVDFGAAISGKDFSQFHLQGSSGFRRAG